MRPATPLHGILALPLAAVLTACSDYRDPPPVAEGKEHIACAIGGAKDFKPVCALDRIETGGTQVLIVRHPDGAFRRFELGKGEHDLSVADGADAAVVTQEGDALSVTVGPDRYRFAATHLREANAP